MKCFWHTCLAVIVTATVASAANAQWDEPAQIGSYQSLLSRAGYGDEVGTRLTKGTSASYRNQDIPAPPGAALAKQHADPTANSVMEGPVGIGSADDIGPVAADCGCGGVCGGAPNCEGRMQRLRGRVGGGAMANCGSGNYVESGANACDAPVYDSGDSAGSGLFNRVHGGADVCGVDAQAGGDSNWVFGVFGLSFRRDYDDGQRIARNSAGQAIYTDDVDHGNFDGIGISLAKRGCDGSGWEAIFWAIDEEDDVTLAGPTTTYLTGLGAVAHPPSGATVEDIFDASDNVRVYRDTDIFNIEFNLLRNVGAYTTRSGRSANYELMGGFRLFNFDESFRYVSNSSAPGYPATIEYRLEAENSLAGFQLGGRSEVCLSDRFRFAYAGTAGVFNNHVYYRQQIIDSDAYSALDYNDTKNDAAFLGQLDLGLIYQISSKARARVGYRALGVAGVALAEDQIPMDFTDTRDLTSANSNGSLLLYGWYYGAEFCF